MGLRHMRALAVAACCLVLAACHDGSSPGAQGAPPGQDVPGAPAGNGSRSHGGHGTNVPVGTYKIPSTFVNGNPTTLQEWHALQDLFWSNCPGGSHCVRPVFTFVDGPADDDEPCVIQDVRVGGVVVDEGTQVRMGSRIVVSLRRPCPGLGGGGNPNPVPSESPSTESPSTEAPSTEAPSTEQPDTS